MKSTTELVSTICNFLEQIGITVELGIIEHDTVLPGIDLKNGGLLIDLQKLQFPGDILHEAGHLAVVPAEFRKTMTGAIDPKIDLEMAGELMAIPWSYAACLHLQIDPHIVFHDTGYQGGGSNLVENFECGRYIGVPMLQWIGLTKEPTSTNKGNDDVYPKMLQWVRD